MSFTVKHARSVKFHWNEMIETIAEIENFSKTQQLAWTFSLI